MSATMCRLSGIQLTVCLSGKTSPIAIWRAAPPGYASNHRLPILDDRKLRPVRRELPHVASALERRLAKRLRFIGTSA